MRFAEYLAGFGPRDYRDLLVAYVNATRSIPIEKLPEVIGWLQAEATDWPVSVPRMLRILAECEVDASKLTYSGDVPWQQELEAAHRIWVHRLQGANARVAPLIPDGHTPDGQRLALGEAEHHPQVGPAVDRVVERIGKRTEDIDL